MREKTKVIYAALDCQEAPPLNGLPEQIVGTPVICQVCETVEPNKNLSYRELTKGARNIMSLKAENFNVLFKEQNHHYQKIEEASFLEFHLGVNTLIGDFKVTFCDDGTGSVREGRVYASWNGATLNVY
jgi:hypothetical protein